MSLKAQFQVAVVDEINLAKTAVTISSGQDSSTILYCGGTAPTGLILPSNWTPCSISFYVCKTPDGDFVPLTNFDATVFQLVTNESQWIPLQPAQFNSILYLSIFCDEVQAQDVVCDFALFPIGQGLHN